MSERTLCYSELAAIKETYEALGEVPSELFDLSDNEKALVTLVQQLIYFLDAIKEYIPEEAWAKEIEVRPLFPEALEGVRD